MLQKKLKILQSYINENFTSDCICYFIANINVLILFVFKKKNKF